MKSAYAWVTTRPCSACGWSGMHWHWGARRFRSLRDLTPLEAEAFDADLGYPRPPGRIE